MKHSIFLEISVPLPKDDIDQRISSVFGGPCTPLDSHLPALLTREVGDAETWVEGADLAAPLLVRVSLACRHHVEGSLASPVVLPGGRGAGVCRVQLLGDRALFRGDVNDERRGRLLEEWLKDLGHNPGTKDVGLEGRAEEIKSVHGLDD